MDTRKTFPPLPRVHALSSTTFESPPIENTSLTLPELFEWHLEHSPNHRLFVFLTSDGTIRTITWAQEVRAMYRGAGIIHSRLAVITSESSAEPPVVAIIAPSDAIPYYTTIVSIIRANCAAFLVSPRNSPLAVAHLINKVGASHILVSRDQAMQDLVSEALEILKTQYGSKELPTQSPMLTFEDLFPPSQTPTDCIPPPHVNRGPDARAIILHSSGSTAFPKPVVTTNYLALQVALNAWFGERDLTDKVFSLHAIPIFHGMGIAMLAWTVSCGVVLSTFESMSPAPIPAPDDIFAAAKATRCDYIVGVPTIVEASCAHVVPMCVKLTGMAMQTWAKSPEYVRWLATRSGLYGGGPLDKNTGDYLAAQGVTLFVLYGTTEAGIMSPMLPAEVGDDWEYFKFSKQFTPHMVPSGENSFELVMRANPYYCPAIVNTTLDEGVREDGPLDHAQYWGEVYSQTNPGPLENMLNQDLHVRSSVMFGRGQFQAGIIVDPKPPYRFDPVDETKLAEFRISSGEPTVERMNAYAPQHSRLFKEMIVVANPSKPFTYTAKGTVRRQAVLEEYAEEIGALYAKVEDSTQASIPPPLHWGLVTTLDFVRKVVSKVLVRGVDDDDDLFEHGCDSLQATYIRNALLLLLLLLRALRDSAHLDTRRNVGNFVYQHNTVRLLASFLLGVATGSNVDAGCSRETQSGKMAAMAAKYLEGLPTRAVPRLENPSGHVVLLTGTTGSLGAYVLARLVNDSAVDRVYALNRPAAHGQSLQSRQKSALLEHGLDSNVLEHSKVVLLESDLSVPGFSLPQFLYAEMHASVTHIIHNAWRVDFHLVLESFELNVRVLFTETGVSPIAYTRISLALRYIVYLLNSRHPLPLAALADSRSTALMGEGSWLGDLRLALRRLPVAVDFNLAAPLSQEYIEDTTKRVQLSLSTHLLQDTMYKGGLPLLSVRPGSHQVLARREYLAVRNKLDRLALSRLLAGDSPLAIVQLRRRGAGIQRNRRRCRFCSGLATVEDEIHVLLECTARQLVGLREEFLRDVYLADRRLWHTRAPTTTVLAKFVRALFALCAEVPMPEVDPDKVGRQPQDALEVESD
ncbi:hypothetical protein FOMPIDRAFT_1055251 [Fomitopsis schrenkii]|uniref:Polyketide synthase phosphopantetheine-binding domain-containing protein n=1 Tax=Fomitopsis schrenkii TaxID=2126942 RepID=S8F5V1_FOMSC|nr:hypothetical protein FOMPIDRAFT_1055251 [Fomitopsis schrenkii]